MNAAFICILEGLWGQAELVPSSKRAEQGEARLEGATGLGGQSPAGGACVSAQPEPPELGGEEMETPVAPQARAAQALPSSRTTSLVH